MARRKIEKRFVRASGLFDTLQNLCARLERHYGDVQDIEFTVEDGELFCCKPDLPSAR